MRKFLLVLLMSLVVARVEAQPRRVTYSSQSVQVSVGPASAPIEALNEVNAVRAQRGLKPYVFDPNLTAGALNVAKFRAERLIAGHTSNDFAGLPPGTPHGPSGCAAWEPSWGWGSCCTYENHTFAGAAYSVGRDGKRYMHLFVR